MLGLFSKATKAPEKSVEIWRCKVERWRFLSLWTSKSSIKPAAENLTFQTSWRWGRLDFPESTCDFHLRILATNHSPWQSHKGSLLLLVAGTDWDEFAVYEKDAKNGFRFRLHRPFEIPPAGHASLQSRSFLCEKQWIQHSWYLDSRRS